eukprot:scaffold29349_cov24-Prasinocladus_malaysianus.AAC.1
MRKDRSCRLRTSVGAVSASVWLGMFAREGPGGYVRTERWRRGPACPGGTSAPTCRPSGSIRKWPLYRGGCCHPDINSDMTPMDVQQVELISWHFKTIHFGLETLAIHGAFCISIP